VKKTAACPVLSSCPGMAGQPLLLFNSIN
jgi:hypothetical protein